VNVLLDTCALSEIRHPDGHPEVKRVYQKLPESDLYISVITLGEIVKGISLLDDGRRKNELNQWVQGLEQYYSEHILPIDRDTAHIWGEITARARRNGSTLAASDGLIAATALANGLHIMTRNVKDFKGTGASLINPWDGL
jgi:predicted nucleic acid-binding protein